MKRVSRLSPGSFSCVLLGLALVACQKSASPAAAPAATPAPAGPAPASVLLVTIDTLRADRVGAYGDKEARTPALDALARDGVVFERAYTPAPETLPAHTSIMTGLLPPAHGVRGNGGFALGEETPVLATTLKAAGLRTAAFIGGFPLSRRYGLARGFDVYDDQLERAQGVHFDFAERPGSEVVAAATRWLASNPGPVFVWVHLFDPHAPYAPPASSAFADAYRGEVAAADAALATLMAVWNARPGANVVAATSDHGEAFGEHGEWSHSLFVYDTTLRVPLILRGGGLKAGARVPVTVGLTDLAATLLDVSGAPAKLPGESLRGALAEGARDRTLYAETLAPRFDFGWSELRAYREGGYKWIRAPKPELYALADDAAEAQNLALRDRAKGASLDASMNDLLGRTGDRQAHRGGDAEGAERLRSLGYVQGPGGRGSGADPKDRVELAKRIAQAVGPFENADAMIETYRSLVAEDRANPLLNLRLADALLRSGKAEESLPFFARVVASGPRSADAHVGYATALGQLGRFAESKRVLEQAVEIDPRSGQVHFNLGEIARLEGRLDDARAQYSAAVSDPITAERAKKRLAEMR